MENSYKISHGSKPEIIKGVNLETALINAGFTGIEIVPLWRRKSNGKYKVYCNETAIILCEWVEKRNQIKS